MGVGSRQPVGEGLHRRKRHWKTEVVVNSLEMLSGRGKKEYAKEAQELGEAAANGTGDETLEAVVAM